MFFFLTLPYLTLEVTLTSAPHINDLLIKPKKGKKEKILTQV